MLLLTFALEWPGVCVLSPFLLLESRTTFFALDATGVVLASTSEQSSWSSWIQQRASVGMTVADTTASDRNILDRVEVATSDSWILPGDAHQVSQQVLRSQQANSDVGGSSPFLEGGRVEIIVS